MTESQSSPGERLIHRGKKFDFAVITGTGRSGRPVVREVVRHPGAVILVPLRSHGGELVIVLVRQQRAAIGVPLLELPAGTLERGENPFGCAARELTEETGFRAATVSALGRFYTSPGLSDEVMHAFLATDLEPVGQSLEDDEDIEVVELPVREVWAMIADGRLADGKSIAALVLAWGRGLLPGAFGGSG